MERKEHVVEPSRCLLPMVSRSVLILDEWRIVKCYVLEEEAGESDDVQDRKGGGRTGCRLAVVIQPYLGVEG